MYFVLYVFVHHGQQESDKKETSDNYIHTFILIIFIVISKIFSVGHQYIKMKKKTLKILGILVKFGLVKRVKIEY